MACSECRAYGGSCPCCEEEPIMIKCETCKGQGYVYYDEDGNDMDADFAIRFPHKTERERCGDCGGYGEVEDEGAYYDPDEKYDSRYDR